MEEDQVRDVRMREGSRERRDPSVYLFVVAESKLQISNDREEFVVS